MTTMTTMTTATRAIFLMAIVYVSNANAQIIPVFRTSTLELMPNFESLTTDSDTSFGVFNSTLSTSSVFSPIASQTSSLSGSQVDVELMLSGAADNSLSEFELIFDIAAPANFVWTGALFESDPAEEFGFNTGGSNVSFQGPSTNISFFSSASNLTPAAFSEAGLLQPGQYVLEGRSSGFSFMGGAIGLGSTSATFSFSVSPASVPEPSGLALLFLGGVGGLGIRRKL